MNGMQKKAFELLVEFVEVCEKHELDYFLVCGSALGAIKYQGFIPWDDDIDVAMYREDYEKFLELAPEMLPQHMFLQNHWTDPEFPAINSKLRDSHTTCIETSASRLNINHGIAIDIFPLDGYPKDRLHQRVLEIKKTVFVKLLNTVYYRENRIKRIILMPLKLLCNLIGQGTLLEWYESMIRKYPTVDTEVLVNHGNWQGHKDYTPKYELGNGKKATFEGLEVRVPAEYDNYLRRKYGDYRQDPPPENQKSHHIYSVVDVDRPYTEYMK